MPSLQQIYLHFKLQFFTIYGFIIGSSQDNQITRTHFNIIELTMAPITFHLLALQHPGDSLALIQALRSLEAPDKPLWVGHCEHWMHEPSLSTVSLLGTAGRIKTWDYLAALPASQSDSIVLPASIANCVSDSWSITADIIDSFVEELISKLENLSAKQQPPLPSGWSADNHQGLDDFETPQDLVISLDSKSRPLHTNSGPADEVGSKDICDLIRYSTYRGRWPCSTFSPSFLASPGIHEDTLPPLGMVSHGGEWSSFRARGGEMDWGRRCVERSMGWGRSQCGIPACGILPEMLADPRYADLDRKFKKGGDGG